MTGSVLAVCLVHQLIPDAGTFGVTAIDKRPVEGAVKVGPYGLRADVQADRKHHGGLDQAVYAYSQDDADWWAAELGREIPPGLFGENLRVAGVDATAPRVGERWTIGEGERALVLEVTKPRNPCMTFARWMGEDRNGWVKRFQTEARLGTYLRVVQNGSVSAGDRITVQPAPDGAPTILDLGPDV